MTIEYEEDPPRSMQAILHSPEYGDIIYHGYWSNYSHPINDWLTYDGRDWINRRGNECNFWYTELQEGYHRDKMKSISFEETPAFKEGYSVEQVLEGQYVHRI